jgi:Uncharacterized conserved protein
MYQRAWYRAPISEFLHHKPTEILGRIALLTEFDMVQEQRDAWLGQIAVLHDQLKGLTGEIFLEFSIPRMGRRIDAVLIIGAIVFVIEFKVGEVTFDRSAIEQVWDYALDLKNFHAASHSVPLVPILVATRANKSAIGLEAALDGVYKPILVGGALLRIAIDHALSEVRSRLVDVEVWAASSYRPTPTIIEAARALYAQHSVEAIARSDAGAKNLHATSSRIETLVEQARENKRKIICFVTGVPGAGKTLVGLNVATRKANPKEPTHAVFLSGNGPLVAVLREALTRDELQRRRLAGEVTTKGKVADGVKAFIQNVHHFRDEALIDESAPAEHVVIFDEAQRAWNLRQTASFMKRKKNRPGFNQSEPEFLVSYMNRHEDWSVVICLVGGGQEINTGEAGIAAWLQAVQSSFPDWHVHISDRLVDSEYAAGEVLSSLKIAHLEPDLHLAVSMRSFRAEHVSAFVKAVLDGEMGKARDALATILDRYPITLTRDLGRAKEWIRSQARGSERYGLVASSKAQRLKPHAVDIRVNVDPVHWFLNDKSDTRSSYYLEDAATEFQVQGLEVDWACVTWDGDLRYAPGGWSFTDFRGDRWTNIKNADNRSYLRNAYRVLLTRARQGMVIFVPPGDATDPTRSSNIYDPTFEYLVSLGLPELS